MAFSKQGLGPVRSQFHFLVCLTHFFHLFTIYATAAGSSRGLFHGQIVLCFKGIMSLCAAYYFLLLSYWTMIVRLEEYYGIMEASLQLRIIHKKSFPKFEIPFRRQRVGINT